MGCWADLKHKWADGWERRMMRWGWSLRSRDYFWHAWSLFLEQVAAIIPISVLQARRLPLPVVSTAAGRPRQPLHAAACAGAGRAMAGVAWLTAHADGRWPATASWPPGPAATSTLPALPTQILVLAIFFRKAPVDAGLQVMGVSRARAAGTEARARRAH